MYDQTLKNERLVEPDGKKTAGSIIEI